MKNMSMEALTHHSAAELPFSLIESEILPRISGKSDVGRCRCVCKQWKSFLSTSTFATMHLRNHTTINDYKLLSLDDAQPPASDVFILASLDGLVCLASRGQLLPKLMFWNPLTGVHKKLPPVPNISVCPIGSIGFYKDSSNDYKLVYFAGKGWLRTCIYSHRLDSWRQTSFPFRLDACYSWTSTTFWGQCLYFTVQGISPLWIICFNVETETFRKISCPPRPGPILGHTIDYYGSLVVLNGCIHLCVSYKILDINPGLRKHRELWRMDGNVGWVKVAALSDPFLPYEKNTRRPICMTSFDNWIVVLDHENKDLKKVKMEHFTTGFPHFRPPVWEDISRRVIYVESLVSPVNP